VRIGYDLFRKLNCAKANEACPIRLIQILLSLCAQVGMSKKYAYIPRIGTIFLFLFNGVFEPRFYVGVISLTAAIWHCSVLP